MGEEKKEIENVERMDGTLELETDATLIAVAGKMCLFNVTDIKAGTDPKLAGLILKARKYINLKLDDAIKREEW